MAALSRREASFWPDNRSFLDIVNGVRAPWQSVPDGVANSGRHLAASLRAAAVSPPMAVTVCAAVAVLGMCAAIYGTSGSVHDTRVDIAREAVAPAAQANTDPQQQPDHAPAMPAPAVAAVDMPPDAASSLVAPQPVAADRSGPLIAALAPADPHLVDPPHTTMAATAALRADIATRPAGPRLDSYAAQLWTRAGTPDAQDKLDRLSADYAELAAERDRLRERVKELEETLSLLQAPASPAPQAAKARPDNSVGAGSAKPGAAVIAFPGIAAGSAAEPPRPAVKNFTTPGSVPNYFTDESGAVLGTPAAAPHR